jgi:VIT1/CCC1 family predicted Fe2+/Mn2+ transporter
MPGRPDHAQDLSCCLFAVRPHGGYGAITLIEPPPGRIMDRQAAQPTDPTLGRVQEFLKQIVFGGTDGIITTFAVVAGFAGAQAQGVAQIGGLAVLVFGLANLFADGVSMGLGEFLSLRAQQDLYRTRRSGEMRSIAEHPARQTERLTQIFARKGLTPSDAETAADIFSRHPTLMTELILNEETGLRPPEGESPVRNGIFTTGAFFLFGAVPLLPYMLFSATPETTRLSVMATLLALLLLGLLRWHAIGDRLWRSLGETVLVGTVCAAVAFVVGQLVGG